MKKVAIMLIAASCLVLTACSDNMGQGLNPANTAMAKNKVNFTLPTSQKWDLVSVEQDTNGYAKSYRSAKAKGLTAEQSFYINYGRNIKTPLLASMHEVVSSLASTGCKRTSSNIEKLGQTTLIFTATADQCTSGRPVWQVFKVFNMTDGQYSIVYSANPKAVSNNERQEMKNVVSLATITPLAQR